MYRANKINGLGDKVHVSVFLTILLLINVNPVRFVNIAVVLVLELVGVIAR
jgi:hypothetical protein